MLAVGRTLRCEADVHKAYLELEVAHGLGVIVD